MSADGWVVAFVIGSAILIALTMWPQRSAIYGKDVLPEYEDDSEEECDCINDIECARTNCKGRFDTDNQHGSE